MIKTTVTTVTTEEKILTFWRLMSVYSAVVIELSSINDDGRSYTEQYLIYTDLSSRYREDPHDDWADYDDMTLGGIDWLLKQSNTTVKKYAGDDEF